MSVKINIAKSAPDEAAFCKQFGLTRLLFQRKGTGYDAEDMETGQRYELKVDHKAAATGNHFLETEQTNDNGETWTKSGFNLTKEQAQWYVVRVAQTYYFFHTQRLQEALDRMPFSSSRTRAGANGNEPGRGARGLLIPVSWMENMAYKVERVTC